MCKNEVERQAVYGKHPLRNNDNNNNDMMMMIVVVAVVIMMMMMMISEFLKSQKLYRIVG